MHKKGWGTDTNPDHVDPPQIPLIKQTSTGKSYAYYVKLKLGRDPTSRTSNLYELSMSLFEHGNPEDFPLFVWNFNMTLASTGTLEMDVKGQYIVALVCG